MTDIREAFVQEFLYTEGIDPFGHTLAELIDLYEMRLGEAKNRWPTIDVGAEWAAMDRWLSEHGAVDHFSTVLELR